MKRVAQAVAVAAVAALFVLLVWKVTRDDSGISDQVARGEVVAAPDFTLDRLDREGTLTLSDLDGKPRIVNFWASWCQPCKREAPLLEKTWQKYKARGLVVVGVDVNDFSGDARRFAKRYGMTFPLVKDGDGQVAGDYGTQLLPETFFVDRRGKVVHQVLGELEQADVDEGVAAVLR